jgi:hypothetical protein
VPGTKGVIRALHEGRDGTWWVAGLAGLSRLRGTSVEHWAEDSGLPDSDLSDVHENPDGSVWVATLGQGLFRFDGQKVTRYTSAQGLFDDTIFQLVADPHGWLWMTSNRGLFRVKLADLQALAEGRRAHLASPSYGLADGLPASPARFAPIPRGCLIGRPRRGRSSKPSSSTASAARCASRSSFRRGRRGSKSTTRRRRCWAPTGCASAIGCAGSTSRGTRPACAGRRTTRTSRLAATSSS